MKHLLSTMDLDRNEAINILDIAEQMAGVGSQEVKKLPALRGRTVINLFFEDSTRTRISFEAAAKRLSADVLNFSAKGSSVSKGESLKDTVQTLEAIGADAIVMRHWASGAAQQLASAGWTDASVINAGDGTHEHPTQALLDAFTLRHHRAKVHGIDSSGTGLDGMKVLIVGDILHSRVARSNLWLLNTLGAEVAFAAPPTLLPHSVQNWPVKVFYNFDEALAEGFDAVMMLRVQAERMQAAYFPSAEEYTRRWGLTQQRYALFHTPAYRNSIIMHPGPMNRGLEICSAAADSEKNVVLAQVANGVATRMAVLYQCMTSPEKSLPTTSSPASQGV